MNKPPNAPPPTAIEEIPFTLTIKGKMQVPAGTHPDLVKASAMAQVNISLSMAHLVESFDIQTGAAGLAIVKG